jgi:osmoprotectant transport system permease protein
VELLIKTYQYLLTHPAEFAHKLLAHIGLSGNALLIAFFLAFPLGVTAARSRWMSVLITNLVGAVRSVPSLAIMALMLPVIGIGYRPALIALTVLAFPPILLNVQAGLQSVSPAVIEAARGMGMSPFQILRRIEIPLAAPVILAGLRTATVEVTASATLGAIIGAGGLGEYIFSGLSMGRPYTYLMVVGALPIAALALTADTLLYRLERLAQKRTTGSAVPTGGIAQPVTSMEGVST